MAIEDIPPRRPRGLGTRLGEILASTPMYRPSAAEALYGPEPVTPSAVEEKVVIEGAPEEAPPEVALPMPEYLSQIDQADSVGIAVSTSRPDRYEKYGYYNQGPTKSTRVHAMQWIPTAITNQLTNSDIDEALSGQSARFKGFELSSAGVFGDILIAFARPSNVQAHSLYVYEHNSEAVWNALKSSRSLGKFVNRLNGGRAYRDSDGERYKDLHKNTMDDGYPYDYWIFNDMDRWSTIRPNNSRLKK